MSNSSLLWKYGLRGRLSTAMLVVGGFLVTLSFLESWRTHTDPGKMYLVGWGMITAAVSFFAAFEQLAARRVMENLPTSSIRSAPQGYVELSGIVRQVGSKTSIKCPRCHLPCLWYMYQGKNYRFGPPASWNPQIVLDDGTGECQLLLHGVDLLGYSMDHLHLHAGDRVLALGAFSTTSQPPRRSPARPSAPATRDDLSRRLQRLKADPARMATLDVNRDGTIDAREWEAAVRMTRAQLEQDMRGVADATRNYLAEPTQRDVLPFVLALGSQDDARRALWKQVFLRLLSAAFAGFALIVMQDNMIEARARSHAKASSPASAEAAALPSSMANGWRLLEQERAAEAAAQFDQAVQQQPGNVEALYWRGRARMQSGQTAPAIQDLEEALRHAPDRLEWFGPLVRHYGAQNDWNSIIRLYDRLLKLHPDHAEALFYRGGAYRMQGNMARAEDDRQAACRLGHSQACSVGSPSQ